jgi:hypothetical protein
MARPPARGRIPRVTHEPERPRETQEGTSEARETPGRYLGADDLPEFKEVPSVAFPDDLAGALFGPGPISTHQRAWAVARDLLSDSRSRIQTKRATKVAEWLDRNEYHEAWDQVHSLIAEPHLCPTGLHDVCGCQVHQAWCPCIHEAEEDLRSILP